MRESSTIPWLPLIQEGSGATGDCKPNFPLLKVIFVLPIKRVRREKGLGTACHLFPLIEAKMIVNGREPFPRTAQGADGDDRIRVLRSETEFFSLPPSLGRINELLSAAPVDLRSLGEAFKDASGFAMEALKLCNSSLFGLSHPIASLEQAVIFMDAAVVRTLLFTSWLIKHTGDHVPARERHSFWQHSLLVAQLSRRIGEWAGYAQPEQVFLTGLFHDIGILPFLTALSKDWTADQGSIFQDVGDSVESQRRRFGTDHCELGSLIGAALGFPLPLIEVAAKHHQRGAILAGMPVMCFVGAAELISQAAGCGTQRSTPMPTGQLIRNALAEYLPGLSHPVSFGLVEALESDIRPASAQPANMPDGVWNDPPSAPNAPKA